MSKQKEASVKFWNPYVVGVGIGLVIIGSFFLTGRGLGAIGAISSVLDHPAPWNDWVVVEIIGVIAGAFLSGLLSRRIKWEVIRGPSLSLIGRLVFASLGGLLMGFGAKMSLGCTSGLALSGGALLGTGSWVFMLAVFAGGYSFAWFAKKLWN